jgi:hypothetical protein
MHSDYCLGGQHAPVFLLDELDEVLHDPLVKVFASKMGVSVGALNFEHAFVDGEHAHIEGAATQIKHQNGLLTSLLVQAVCDGSSSGLVDDALHTESGDGSSILCRLHVPYEFQI